MGHLLYFVKRQNKRVPAIRSKQAVMASSCALQPPNDHSSASYRSPALNQGSQAGLRNMPQQELHDLESAKKRSTQKHGGGGGVILLVLRDWVCTSNTDRPNTI